MGSTCCTQPPCQPHGVASPSRAGGSYLGHRFLLWLLWLPHEGQLWLPPHLLEVEAQQGQCLQAGRMLGTACGPENNPPLSYPPPLCLWMGTTLLLPSTLTLQLFNNWDAAARKPEPST